MLSSVVMVAWQLELTPLALMAADAQRLCRPGPRARVVASIGHSSLGGGLDPEVEEALVLRTRSWRSLASTFRHCPMASSWTTLGASVVFVDETVFVHFVWFEVEALQRH